MTASDRPGDNGLTPDVNDTIRAKYDWSSRIPSTAVVETVVIASDREPTVIEPLYGSVDPDALDTLVRSNGAYATDGDTTISFAFAGHDVTVRSNGAVVVRPVEPRSDSE